MYLDICSPRSGIVCANLCGLFASVSSFQVFDSPDISRRKFVNVVSNSISSAQGSPVAPGKRARSWSHRSRHRDLVVATKVASSNPTHGHARFGIVLDFLGLGISERF